MTLYSLIITLRWKYLLDAHCCSAKNSTSVEFTSTSAPSMSLNLPYCSSQKAAVPLPSPQLPFTLATAILPKCPYLQLAQRGRLQLHSCTAQNTTHGATLSHLFAKSTQPNFCSLICPFSCTAIVPDLELTEVQNTKSGDCLRLVSRWRRFRWT